MLVDLVCSTSVSHYYTTDACLCLIKDELIVHTQEQIYVEVSIETAVLHTGTGINLEVFQSIFTTR